MLGDGFAVIPSDGNFYAPCSGTITLFHKANHAFGITTEDGLEVLVHVGLDTVELGGKDLPQFYQKVKSSSRRPYIKNKS